MPEVVSVHEDLQVIQVTSTGHVSEKDLHQTLASILKFQDERGFARVFVDLTAATSFPPTHLIYEFGMTAARELTDTSVAMLVAPVLREDLTFLGHVMHNRGRQARVFHLFDTAIEWLNQRPVWRPNQEDGHPSQ